MLKPPDKKKKTVGWIIVCKRNVFQVLSRIVPENNDHIGKSAVIACYLQMLS